MYKKLIVYVILIIIGIGIVQAQPAQKAYLVPVKGEINNALVVYVDKAIQEAQASNASQIIFEIDTEGGLVDAALKMSQLIINAPLPTVTYIKNNAISAGVIISISGDQVIANQAISIGSAETRPREEKYISYWTGKLRSVAELRGRNAEIIAGMADADLEIEGIKPKGKLLNLTAREALKHGIVDEVVEGRSGLYEYLDMRQSDVVVLEYDFRTNIARITNSAYVSTLLITLGIIGIVGEIFTAGFGLFGSVGILSFALFFAGRVLAGHADWSVLILFVAGIILLGIEIAIPGFGVPGIAGISCIVISILIGSASPVEAAGSFAVAIVLSIGVLYIVFKHAPKNKLFAHIILKDEQKNDQGYISHKKEKEELLGLEGEAITLLRPAGTIQIGDKRVDAVSEGEYIERGSRVKVITVEGGRVVVRKTD